MMMMIMMMYPPVNRIASAALAHLHSPRRDAVSLPLMTPVAIVRPWAGTCSRTVMAALGAACIMYPAEAGGMWLAARWPCILLRHVGRCG